MKDRVQVTLRIEGMTCDGCARHVTEALKSPLGWTTNLPHPTPKEICPLIENLKQ